jgi:hypothetical protein
MKTRLCLLALLLVVFTSSFPAHGQGEKKPRTPEDYRPRTLKELSMLRPDPMEGEPQQINESQDIRVMVHSDLLPSRVKVVYGGATRPLTGNRLYVIKEWAKQYAGAPEFYTANYQVEALFSENGESYWVAVRKQFLPELQERWHKGDPVELFLIKMGNVGDEQKLEAVLLVEKFVKQ